MAKKGSCCELCNSEAKIFCESDQARLCWDCDDKVHAANFLVAKHTRTALCQVCHCTTPWKASGPKLGRTVSVCGACVAGSDRAGVGSNGSGGFLAAEEEAGRRRDVRIAGEGRGSYVHREEREDDGGYDDCGTDDDDEEEDYDSDSYGEDDFHGCDDDDENQVVPWTSMPPESATSTSCSEEDELSFAVDGGESVSTSGFRDSAFFLHSDDEIGLGVPSSSSVAVRSRVVSEEDEEIVRGGFMRPWKQRRVAN